MSKVSGSVFVTGATGYIGGRLVPRLLDEGYRVRALARDPRKIAGRPWAELPGLSIVDGDLSDPARTALSMKGCDAAYYLVHSMLAAGKEYARRDRELAHSFARAAREAGVKRIIYLGGLGETGDGLSEHLTSRREVEAALASTGIPVTVLRAAMIIGSGSASFEILRYLVERLPVMVTPRWVQTPSQPISVRNVLGYLVAVLENEETEGRTLDIGGPEVLSYREIMQIMAEVRGLRKRWIVPVPVLTPRLSSLWIHLVTPASHRIAMPLAEGLRNRVVCRDDRAHRLMPQRLLTVRESIEAALGRMEAGDVETSWSDAGPMPGDPDWSGGTVFLDVQSMDLGVTPDAAFRAICRVGGRNGWHAAGGLWRLRGFVDRLLGGPGLGRGRRDPEQIGYGDALDFWRVTGLEKNRRLELRAEMKLPGVAQLEFQIDDRDGAPGCRLTQTAKFVPKGLGGLLYWFSVLPFHQFIFRGMLRGIAKSAVGGAPAGGEKGGKPGP